jgi:hypothetical protein
VRSASPPGIQIVGSGSAALRDDSCAGLATPVVAAERRLAPPTSADLPATGDDSAPASPAPPAGDSDGARRCPSRSGASSRTRATSGATSGASG